MAFGVFIHRSDSSYEDIPAEQYQFPKQYLTRAQHCEGDWIVYLEPSKVANTKGYFAVAKVQKIIPDPRHRDMFLALIEPGTYLDFGDPVPFRDTSNTVVETGILNDRGNISGRAQAAVRSLSPMDFSRIVELGLGRSEDILPRTESFAGRGFSEPAEAFQYETDRDRVAQLTNRAVRDRNFRLTVLRAYGERCAITGLRLINGGGRAEVEAAHIRPVEKNGPDIVSNGIALSGTVHWMFDRGLIGLNDDLTILISRQANDPDAIRSMINGTGSLLAPDRVSERPRAEFLSWHREHTFKR